MSPDRYILRLCTLLILLLPLLSPAPLATVLAAEGASSSLRPLPGSCGGGLPPDASVPVCCMFGYVIIDGQAVAGATVTITSAHGTRSYTTDYALIQDQPTYRMDLSSAPLSAQQGDTITIKAEYSGHSAEVTHVVIGGSQQVDVVLPRNQLDDYVFMRQIWQQGPEGSFLYPTGVAVDGTGTVYVVDSQNARVQVFNAHNQALTRYWGTPGDGPAQFFHPVAITADKDGAIYVTDTYRVRKFTNTGIPLAMWGDEQSDKDGKFNQPLGIAVDTNGFVYIADSGNHRIQKLTKDGAFVLKWGTFGNSFGQLNLPTGIAVDANGFVYVADSGNHRIQKFTSTGSFVQAWGEAGTANGQLNGTEWLGIAIDSAGNILVSDSANQRIQKFTSDGTFLTVWGSQGTANRQFNYPLGIAASSTGDLYIADRYNHRIQRFDSQGSWQSSFGSRSTAPELFVNPAAAALDASYQNLYIIDHSMAQILKTNAQNGAFVKAISYGSDSSDTFSDLKDIAIDSNNNVFVVDTGTNRALIRIFNQDGAQINAWGSYGTGTTQLIQPHGIALGSDGTVYVADTGNNRIQLFSTTGAYISTWGTTLGLNRPRDVFASASGFIYVADTDNHRILKLDSNGNLVATWSDFITPQSITEDSNGNIYVSDAHRIQKFTSAGTRLAVWSNYGNGLGELSGPSSLSIDGTGNVYVTDVGNRRIQVFKPIQESLPVATIVAARPLSVVQGQSVDLIGRGSASMPGSQIIGYEWTLDGSTTPFSRVASTTLDSTSLAPGRHSIALRVTDSGNRQSLSQRVELVVTPSDNSTTQWTFLLYLDGAYGDISSDLSAETTRGVLYRLTHMRMNANVTVVALYDGPATGDSVRYLIHPDGSSTHESLNEVNMGDPDQLASFIRNGQRDAPADHYYLAIADHANGIDGIAWDANPLDHLTNGELRTALQQVTQNGAQPIDVLHLDGCLMGMVENVYQLRGLTQYIVAYENLGWSAFAYDSYLELVTDSTSASELATNIAERYAQIVQAYQLPFTVSVFNVSASENVGRAMKTNRATAFCPGELGQSYDA